MASDERVGFASDKQRGLVAVLLRERDVSAEAIGTIELWMETVPVGAVSSAIDMLKAGDPEVVPRLMAASEAWRSRQSDIPVDDTDLPEVDEVPDDPPAGDGAHARTPPEPDDEGRVWAGAANLRSFLRPIDDLRPHPGNARRGDVPAIAESLRRFGQVRAVLVDERDTIIAGHHVTRAARLLDWTHVAAVQHEFESADDALDYLIADNQVAELGTVEHRDQISLLEEVERRGSWEGTGFSPDDLADMRALQKHSTEMVRESDLKPHPKNYRNHPEDQREHLMQSLREHGFYRNIVVARDGTVLAGHGILEAAREVGLKKVPITRLDIDPDGPEAMKVIAGDNEMNQLGELDDRALSEMLREVKESGDVSSLLGTGYDAQTLATLVMVTRPASEIKDMNHAAEWIGLPGFEEGKQRIQLVISFENTDDRDALCERLGDIDPHYHRGDDGTAVWSTWWPPRERTPLKAVRFEDKTDGDGTDDEEAGE